MSNSLPPGWIKVSLGDLLDRLQYGYTASASTTAIGPRLLRITDLRDEGVDWETVPTCVMSEADLEKYCLADGDFVFARSGSIEKAWRVRRPPLAVFASYLIRGRPLERRTAAWLEQFLKSGSYLGQIGAAAAGSGMQNVNAKKLASVSLPLAPLAEQRRIVAKLDALTERSRRAKAALDAIPALIEKFKQSVLAAAFRGDLTADWRAAHPDVEPASELLERIRVERRRRWEEAELAKLTAKGKAPTDDRWKAKYEEPEAVDASELPELPRGWCWARWEQIGVSKNGRPFPSSEYVPSGVRLLRPGNLHMSGGLHWTNENTRHLAEHWATDNPDLVIGPGQLVMNLTAQSLKDEFLGRVCLSDANERCLLNQRLALLTPILVHPPYLLWLFKSPLVRAYVDELNSGSLIQHMFTSQVANFALPLPPLDEQIAIADIVDAKLVGMSTVNDVAHAAEAMLAGLDRSILAKAFRGELVPQDPSDEPASVLLERIRAERAAADGADGAANGKPGRRRRAAPT